MVVKGGSLLPYLDLFVAANIPLMPTRSYQPGFPTVTPKNCCKRLCMYERSMLSMNPRTEHRACHSLDLVYC